MNPPEQPQQVPIFEQVTYPGTFVDVISTPDGGVIEVITVPQLGKQILIPMDQDAARTIGSKLTAPHIVPATNGHGPAG